MHNRRGSIKHRDNAGFGGYPQGFEGAANRWQPSISRPVLKTLVLWRYRGRRGRKRLAPRNYIAS